MSEQDESRTEQTDAVARCDECGWAIYREWAEDAVQLLSKEGDKVDIDDVVSEKARDHESICLGNGEVELSMSNQHLNGNESPTYPPRESGPTITFGGSGIEHLIDVFGWTTDDEGTIVDSDGSVAPSWDGEPVTLSELGGVVEDRDGNPVLLRDSFVTVCEYVDSDL